MDLEQLPQKYKDHCILIIPLKESPDGGSFSYPFPEFGKPGGKH